MTKKRMKRLILTIALIALGFSASANPLWMRYPTISPKGDMIAFTYKGDIYTVSSSGGTANRLTTSTNYESTPIWSPDGKSIAFSSDRYGNRDIFIVNSKGGEPRRVTTDSYSETPTAFTPDGKHIIFTSSRNPLASDVRFPAPAYSRSFMISVEGGREQLLTPAASSATQVSPRDGGILFENVKGGEDEWRKHQTSSIARDLVLFNPKTNIYKKLTNNIGEDRNPVFTADGKGVYYLAERGGDTFNVFYFDTDNSNKKERVTNFKTHPVRFLSIADDNTLAYGYHGEIYTQQEGKQPKKVNVNIINDVSSQQISTTTMRGGITTSAVSNDGSQVAYVIRGEVYVSSVEFGTTKRITNTPEAEKGVSFSKDGRTLIYGSDRDGVWNIYQAKIVRDADIDFANASLIEESPLFSASKEDRMLPTYSPNGEEIAYIEGRNRLMVYNVKSKKHRQVTDGSYHYTNHTNGFSYDWSPNGKMFALVYIANQHDPYGDIGIVSANGGEITNITESGYMSGNPCWAMNGEALMYQTEYFGMRNHASWGSQSDIMMAFLTQDAYDKYRMTKNEYDLMKAEEKRLSTLNNEPKKESKAKGKSKKGDKSEEAESEEPNYELSTITQRIVRVTPFSSSLGDMIVSKDNSKLFFIMNKSVYEINLRSKAHKMLFGGTSGGFIAAKNTGTIFIISANSIAKIAANGGSKSNVSFNPVMELDRVAEREYMFNHVYTQELKRFYRKDMHGVDWSGLKKAYETMLPHINNNYDYAEMLSELLGELNVSHTGASYRPTYYNADNVAELGLFFDTKYSKDGLKVDEVVTGSPFDNAKTKLEKGAVIVKIDGKPIKKGEEYYTLLNRKVGVRTLITFTDANGKEWEELVKPISKGQFNNLLYNRWVKWQEDKVKELSNGRIGYVHIKGMSDEHFRNVYSKALGKYNHCDAIIIDTRNNGGGRMHEDIEIFFSGEKYLTQVIRGREACDMPSRRWNKPSVMLMNEANYSNAHGTPWVYKKMGIGRLVGMPVPGTMTSVNWERLQDTSLVYGIPVVGYRTAEGEYLENSQLEPDVKVENNPANLANGRDEQLEAAVKDMLDNL